MNARARIAAIFDRSAARGAQQAGSDRPRALFALSALIALLTLALGVPLASAAPPAVTIENASEVGYNSAKATGHIDPGNEYALWHFEYATQAQFTNSEWAEATQSGLEFLPAEMGNTEVSARLEGLATGTTYHLRLVAASESGEEANAVAASTFTTEAVNAPEAQIDPVSAITDNSAHLSGTVNSGGSGPGEKAGSYAFSCSPSCPGIESQHNFDAEGFADGADHSVQANASGLLPNTQYTVTLTARNAAGEESKQTTFTTDAIAPEAFTAYVAPRDTDSARLNAYVIPNNSDTTYFFQYGPEDCSANPCTSVPISEDALVETTDMESHLVSQELEGLSESTTYHYRVVAENSAETVFGADKTFETRSVAEMYLAPRGYELVNPPEKGNQYVSQFPLPDLGLSMSNTQDGEAIGWLVASGAPGATIGAGNLYISTRKPTGWDTFSVVGAADKQYGNGNKDFTFVASSPDLSHFILASAEGVLTNSGNVVVRAERGGGQEVLHPLDGGGGEDVSEDLQHIYHVDPSTGKLYDYGNGTPEEVGLLPDGSSPACGIFGFRRHRARNSEYHWVSTDGSRVFFESQGSTNCDGSADPGNAAVYVRNRTTDETIELAPKGQFIRASRDGQQAVYLTNLSLTGDDSNSTQDLYMWSESSGNRCLTCSAPTDANVTVCPGNGDLAGGYCGTGDGIPLVEVSEDLSHIYFLSPNTLAPNEHRGGGTYLVTSDGVIHYVGPPISLAPQPYDPRATKLTPDGAGALFTTARKITSDKISCSGNACEQYYFYDDIAHSIECVSCVPNGVTKHGMNAAEFIGGFQISRDGHTIVFQSKEKLLPSDVNGGSDIYQWHNGQLGLVTDGVTKFPGGRLESQGFGNFSGPTVRGISADGRDIFFSLIAPLTGFEQDGQSNLYDARIGGGFPPPSPQVHCDGDACQGALQAPPPPVRSSSSNFVGEGNVKERGQARCRGAKTRRKGRCVTRHVRCHKQGKAKQRCAKRHSSATHRQQARNYRGGAK